MIMNKKKYLSLAKKSADIQINELKKIKKVFNNSFIKAVDLILNCKGKVIFAGIEVWINSKKDISNILVLEFLVFFVIQLKHYMVIWVK